MSRQFDFKCESVTYTIPANLEAPATFFYKDASGKPGIIAGTLNAAFYDKDKNEWTNADGYIGSLGNDNPTKTLMMFTSKPNGVSDVDLTLKNDTDLIKRLSAEYCYLSTRYQAYLTAFLAEATKQTVDNAKATTFLERLIDLNQKLNAFAKLVDWYANQRAYVANARTSELNVLNTTINSNLTKIDSTLIHANNAVLTTRREMVRYTKEKNNAITNQISLWASLNIVAIAIIFHLYRTL